MATIIDSTGTPASESSALSVVNVTLDIKQNKLVSVLLKQYNNQGQQIKFTVTDNGEKIELKEIEHTVLFKMMTPDGRRVSSYCAINENDHTAVLTVAKNYCSYPGKGTAELEVMDALEESQVGTMNLDVVIENSVYPDEMINGSSTYQGLDEKINAVRETCNSAITAKEETETIRDECVDLNNQTAQNTQLANDYANMAQSYANGESGAREGEETDNAKYYYNQTSLLKTDTETIKTELLEVQEVVNQKASAAESYATNASNSATEAENSASQTSIDRETVTALANEVNNKIGSPLTASTSSDMINQNKIYVYTGSEDGYTFGNWYYYDGSSWVSGGIYNSTAFETDSELLYSGQAADAKATGDKLSSLKDDITNIENIVGGKVCYKPTEIIKYRWILSNNNKVVKNSSTDYYSTEAIDISNLSVGTEVKTKSSIVGINGVFITDKDYNILDYVTGNNATEKGYIVNPNAQIVTFIVPENAKYIMSDIRSVYATNIEDYYVYGYENKVEQFKQHINEKLSGAITSYESIGNNLYDISKQTSGFLQQTGLVESSEVYVTSDFIPIKANQSVTTYRRIRNFMAYDENQNPIAESYVKNATSGSYTYTASVDGYIRASFYKNDSYFQIEYGTKSDIYQPFKITKIIEETAYPSKTIMENVGNILNGKKWCVIGDSFTEGIANDLIENGKYQNYHKCYPYLIGNRNNMEIVQFFRGGRTMAYPSDGSFTNSLTCPTDPWFYQNIPTDTDYITIMLGINDLNHGTGSGTTPDGEDATGVITLGTINDTSIETYCGAYNTVLSWIRNNIPFAHVGIIVTNGTQREEWTNAQIAIAKKWGYPYIDLNGDERTPAMIRTSNPNISAELKTLLKRKQAVNYDGNNTHPNTEAHEYESAFIETWLRGI